MYVLEIRHAVQNARCFISCVHKGHMFTGASFIHNLQKKLVVLKDMYLLGLYEPQGTASTSLLIPPDTFDSGAQVAVFVQSLSESGLSSVSIFFGAFMLKQLLRLC